MQYDQRYQAPEARQGATAAPIKVRAPKEWALGAVLLIFGALGWLSGAKYTLFGWASGLNIFLVWLGLPLRVPAPVGWLVLLAVPLGLMYSRVETRIWHKRSATLMRTPLFWLGWLIIVGTDVGSTFLGVRDVTDQSWQIAQQVAANGYIAFAWACILTFAPEWAILGGMKFLRR